jgi:SHS2 domain-containing protein
MNESVQPPERVTGNYRLLEHTADMGIEARAATLEALFVCAARGLQEILFGSSCLIEARQQLKIELQAADWEELLVAWLGEILFLVEQRSFCPAVFHIEDLVGHRLTASLVGEYQREGLSPLREVKAVTYHRLRVQEQGGGWQARVYLDL